MATTKSPKEKEIQKLNELYNLDGYFADYFSVSSVEAMESNIRNDFPFMNGTDFSRKYDLLRREYETLKSRCSILEAERDTRDNTITDLEQQLAEATNTNHNLLRTLVKMQTEPCEDIAVAAFGRESVIQEKLHMSIGLSGEDSEYLIKMFNRNR